jgi:hypothetical protein
MATGRAGPHAVLLADGRVLVVGNDSTFSSTMVRDDSAAAELWDPATGTWRATPSLNRPRAEFAAVPLADGRALVTGGLDRGAADASPGTVCEGSGLQQSFSSTYVYDARTGQEGWSRAGLLGTARTAPAAAVLADGRVLVAGGYYLSAATGSRATAPGAQLAAFRPAGVGAWGPPADVSPNFFVPALATAELFDPVTGTWSATGPLRYARMGAVAATLTDGRVLVVGSGPYVWVGRRGGAVAADDHAYGSAEIYDPTTGRFSLTGGLPIPEAGDTEFGAVGSLVALADGGALLVGNEQEWKHGGSDTRSFRFDARTGRWTEVGTAVVARIDNQTGEWSTTGGVDHLDALVVRLPDGRVLVAGGVDFPNGTSAVTRSAELYDPETNEWSPLPPMPAPRAGGAAVALPDGSVLLIGGYDQAAGWGACDAPMGLASAVRFVPSP